MAFETTTDGQYRLDEFYCRSTGKGDNGITIYTKIPAELHEQGKIIIESGRIPEYKRLAYMIRDAYYHRLRYIQDNIIHDPRLDEVLERERMHQEVLRFEYVSQKYTEMIEAERRTFENLARVGDWNALGGALGKAAEVAERLPHPYGAELWDDVKRYRQRYRSQILRVET